MAGKHGKTVKKLYPNETWTTEKAGEKSSVFVSSSRKEDGAKNPEVYASDKMMAVTLAKTTGEDVFMLPERNKAGKNPDCFFDGTTMEMKHVRGGRNKVGKNAIEALGQSKNTFLFVDKDIPIDSCLSKITGSVKMHRRGLSEKGETFVEPPKDARLYIFTQGKLYKNVWGDVL